MNRPDWSKVWRALAVALVGPFILEAAAQEPGQTHGIPFFPSASDAFRTGFARVVNHSADEGEVRIDAIDDEGESYGPVMLAVDADEAAHFNSDDLESGNAEKGLSDGVGPGHGAWRLQLTSDLDIEVLSYVRTGDGLLTSMHDTAPSEGGRHRIAFFNPGSNESQVSRLRLVNPGEEAAEVSIVGVDDLGESPGSEVTTTIPAGASRTYTAAALESGGEGLEGALGDGEGKWRLTVESAQPIVAMSLLSDPTGHLTNLSTAPGRESQGPPDLVVVSPSVSNDRPVTGAAFTLSATVRNDGGAPSPATTLRYYRSADATITTTDRAVGTVAIAGLAASGSASESVELAAPTEADTYYYGACVDAVAEELDTTNNCSVSVKVDVEEPPRPPPPPPPPPPPGSPDLVVVSPSVNDDGPAAGATFTLSATVRNDGNGASAATTLRYYRSTDATITASDTPVESDAVVGRLPASGSSRRSVELTAPSTPGTYHYGACVDAVAQESDTTNNCSTSVSVTVEDEAPSVSIVLSPGHQVPRNTAITATITLSNLDAAGYSSVMFRADLTVFGLGETRCDGDDTGKDIEIPVDESKEIFTVRVYDACPHFTYGNYTLVARMFDADDRTELASATTNFLMSRYLASGEVAPRPPAPGVKAWLDPGPPPVMYAGQWYRLQVRADVRLYLNDHVGVNAYGSEPYLLTSEGELTPLISVEEDCPDPYSDVVDWRRAIHQALHIAACGPGTAVVSVIHETEGVAPLYTYDVRILPARTADETRIRGVSAPAPTHSR